MPKVPWTIEDSEETGICHAPIGEFAFGTVLCGNVAKHKIVCHCSNKEGPHSEMLCDDHNSIMLQIKARIESDLN